MSNGLVTITIAGLMAGVVITITAPPIAAVLMVGWISTVWLIGYLILKKQGG
jgi:hypothetical protein